MSVAGWKVERLGDHVRIASGVSPAVARPQIAGSFPYVKVEDLNSTAKYLREARQYSDVVRGVVPGGSVVFPKRGAAIATNKVRLAAVDLLMDTNMMALVPKPTVTSEYLYYVLLDAGLVRLADYSTIPQINNKHIAPLAVPIPPLAEQQRIAEILRTWDDAIALNERLAVARRHQLGDLTRALVAAVGGRRLPLAHVAHPLTTKNAAGESRVLTTSARHGLIDQREYFGKRIASADLSGYFLLERDDFAYNRSSSNGHPYGAIRRLTAHDQGVVSTLNLCFSVSDTRVTSPDYLDYLLSSGYLDDQLVEIAHEGARAHGLLNVSKAEFFELVVPVPDREVQDQVVDVLDAVRGEVGLLDHKTALLRAQKRGLMQKLLSGEIRVGVDDD